MPGLRSGYANAQVDFDQFARLQADQGNDAYLDEEIDCLEDHPPGPSQRHPQRCIPRPFIEQDYKTGFFRALFEDRSLTTPAALVLRRYPIS